MNFEQLQGRRARDGSHAVRQAGRRARPPGCDHARRGGVNGRHRAGEDRSIGGRARRLRRGAPGRRRSEPRAPGRLQVRTGQDGHRRHRQQSLRFRPAGGRQRDAIDQRRGQRRRRRRRHGVDVQRTVPAAQRSLGVSLRRRHARGRDDFRRSLGSVFSDDDVLAGQQGRDRAGPDARRARPVRAGQPSTCCRNP